MRGRDYRAGPRLALRVRPVPGRGPPSRQRAQPHPRSGRSTDGRARCMSGPKAGYRCTPAGPGSRHHRPGQERASLRGARCACPADRRRQPRLPRLDRERDRHSQHPDARADHMTQAAHPRYDNRAGRERTRQDRWIGVSYGLLMASSISGKLVPVRRVEGVSLGPRAS